MPVAVITVKVTNHLVLTEVFFSGEFTGAVVALMIVEVPVVQIIHMLVHGLLAAKVPVAVIAFERWLFVSRCREMLLARVPASKYRR